jgi:hypothetical protein
MITEPSKHSDVGSGDLFLTAKSGLATCQLLNYQMPFDGSAAKRL